VSAVLETAELSKRFGATVALDSVALSVARGELHALVGHNGAGKSTLVNVLAGVIRQDAGSVYLHGRPIELRTPRDAESSGLGVVHQRLELCGNLTVAANIALGREPRGAARSLHRRQMREVARHALARVEAQIDVDAEVADLPVAQRQLVAIARALVHARDILILDEPTAALSLHEAGSLFELLATLRKRGFAILFISHRLEEVLQHSTHVTVLRGGSVVADVTTGELTEAKLLEAMLGRRLQWKREESEETAAGDRWRIAARKSDPPGPSLELELPQRKITGLLGMPGSGRETLMLALVGRERSWKVEITDATGKSLRLSPRNEKIGFIPNDRGRYGIFRNLNVQSNIAIGLIRMLGRLRPFRSPRRERAVVRSQLDLMSIRSRGPEQMVTELSGGNQQKVILARALVSEPALLLLDEPTNGVDVGSRDDIYKILRRHAQGDRAILVASQDEEELARYCDSIFVLNAAGLHGPLTPPFERHQLVSLASAGLARPVTA
jgi:ABC-type sugar transport system ATPase subunit